MLKHVTPISIVASGWAQILQIQNKNKLLSTFGQPIWTSLIVIDDVSSGRLDTGRQSHKTDDYLMSPSSGVEYTMSSSVPHYKHGIKISS